MKKIAVLALIFNSIICISQKITKSERLYGLSVIWKEMDYNFPYFNEYPNINWDSLYISYVEKVEPEISDKEYYKYLSEFISVFHEGHTTIVSPSIFKNNKRALKIWPSFIDNKVIVIGIGEKYKEQIPLLSEIVEINNVPVLKYIDQNITPYFSHPIHIRHEWLIKELFYDTIGTVLNVRILTPEKKYSNINLKITDEQDTWFKILENEKFSKTFYYETLNENIAYINFGNTLSYQSVEDFHKILDTLQNAKGLIFDLRNTFGGSSVGCEICKLLTNDSTITCSSVKVRINNSACKALGAFNDTIVSEILRTEQRFPEYNDYYINNAFEDKDYELQNDFSQIHLNQPLVVLISENTASAAESFLITLKNINRGISIGNYSYGSSCQPLIIPLFLGGYAKICSQKPFYNNNTQYTYTTPDIILKPSLDDLKNEKDVVLEKAIEIIKSENYSNSKH